MLTYLSRSDVTFLCSNGLFNLFISLSLLFFINKFFMS